MIAELEPIFEKYEAIVKQVDEVFEKVRSDHPDCVKCTLECADCCHALFDLSLVEAIYINRKFLETLEDKKADILEEANRIDRRLHQMKRKAFKAVENGQKAEEQVVLEMAAERSRCPLLNKENRCDLYAFRPITCRLYGIPTAIDGRGHTCGLSGFKEGVSYPTVNLDAVNAKLKDLSQEIVTVLRSKHVKMGDVLMPVSMALLTVFDKEYLGVPSEDTKEPTEEQD
ncbi:YkgJ family cysteine cluster protein [uncultured Desulfosarcina sp.]|uniref:YkgJ family cysteine cluster protein n=1 Tax=uncultured Desulfosarcina sp. TaxID=218289 RepID=UPI0029C6D02F|nr:YkgJ family cysteine cluster protein [uncultured Desulfosarcina sp.]